MPKLMRDGREGRDREDVNEEGAPAPFPHPSLQPGRGGGRGRAEAAAAALLEGRARQGRDWPTAGGLESFVANGSGRGWWRRQRRLSARAEAAAGAASMARAEPVTD
jgi:hypothetical protein